MVSYIIGLNQLDQVLHDLVLDVKACFSLVALLIDAHKIFHVLSKDLKS